VQLIERISLAAEDGTSMVEVMVGLAMGMVVLAGLSMLLIVTMHGNARVDARVESTDNARLTMTRIMEELHSACVKPTAKPVQEGSTANKLILVHGSYGQATTPSELATKSEITYLSGALSQVDQHATGESNGEYVYGSAPEAARILVSNVGPIESSKPVFKYYKYENGHLSNSLLGTSLTAKLGKLEAEETILVNVEFKAEPKSEPVADNGAGAAIRNSATLRLTPPSYTETAKAFPCQ
jgi:hypothetical protein